MSELQQHYDNCKAGYFVREDASECGCRGSGWFLSQVDTWHKCRAHNDGQPDPEYGEDDDWADYYRAKYKAIASKALAEHGRFGVTAAGFNSMAKGHMDGGGVSSEFAPKGWVEAATLVVEALEQIHDYS